MGGKITLLEIASIVFINLTWLIVIGIWILQFFNNEIGNVIRTYCFGYGIYSRDVIMFRTLVMFLTPFILSLILFLIFYKRQLFKRLFFISYIVIFLTFLLANAISRSINKPIEISYNLKISEIPQNLELFDENGNLFFFETSKIYIITFFYSACQGSCPLQIELIRNISKNFPNYNFLLISFDPRDKKERLYELKIKYALSEHVKLLNSKSKAFREFLLELGFPENFESDIIKHPIIFLICKGNKIYKAIFEINEEKLRRLLYELS